MFEKHPGGPKVFEYFRDHAPGVAGVVFDMEGVEEAKEIASQMGMSRVFLRARNHIFLGPTLSASAAPMKSEGMCR